MEMVSSIQERPEVSAKERASHDMIKQILKLRWIGMDVEADEMQLDLRRVEPRCTLLAGPYETE